MTEQLEQTLSKVIEKSLALAEKTGEFVVDQAPDLLQEFYTWHTMKAGFYVLLGFVFIMLGIFLPKLWGEKEEDRYSSIHYLNRYFNEDIMTLNVINHMVFGIVGTIMFLVNLHSLIYILVAPKLYIIEYFIN